MITSLNKKGNFKVKRHYRITVVQKAALNGPLTPLGYLVSFCSAVVLIVTSNQVEIPLELDSRLSRQPFWHNTVLLDDHSVATDGRNPMKTL